MKFHKNRQTLDNSGRVIFYNTLLSGTEPRFRRLQNEERTEMQRILTFTLIILFGIRLALAAQEAPNKELAPADRPIVEDRAAIDKASDAERSTVRLPVNLYDTHSFDESTWPYIRGGVYAFGPGFVTVWGIIEWGWFDRPSFDYKPSHVWGAHALNGASDKFGHLYATYAVKRMSTFFFRSTGSSPVRANIEGGIYASAVQLILETGDGFSSAQGFDIYDVVFNSIGVGIGMLLDGFPVLDRMFALQWEYVPTKKYRKAVARRDSSADFFTDYSGQKYLLVTKLGGIPYLSLTPLRYVNIDLGYYARGYYDKNFDPSTRNLYIGISLNYAIALGDLLPTGWTSSTLQTAFNHYHPPFDIEAKDWELTRTRNM